MPERCRNWAAFLRMWWLLFVILQLAVPFSGTQMCLDLKIHGLAYSLSCDSVGVQDVFFVANMDDAIF
jgi:hypothetical protein